jgi:uncharacterized protein YecT (DUF1311 family)
MIYGCYLQSLAFTIRPQYRCKMKHYKKLIIILLLSVFQGYAQTAKEDKIDEEFHGCLVKDTTQANISVCAFVAYDKWNKEMQISYKKLLKAVKKDKDRTAIRQSQTAWTAYKNAEFKSYDNMFNHQGRKWILLRKEGQIAIVRTRALQLRSYLDAIKDRK